MLITFITTTLKQKTNAVPLLDTVNMSELASSHDETSSDLGLDDTVLPIQLNLAKHSFSYFLTINLKLIACTEHKIAAIT